MSLVRVACSQLEPRVGDPANAERVATEIAAAAAEGADLIVLPELCTSGYVFRDAHEARAAALHLRDPAFERWASAAGSAVVVAGFCEIGPGDELYNSAVVVDEDGVRAVYRKVHLWDAEKLVFTPGSAPPPVVDTRVGPLGIAICYDLEFPEVTRALALAGALILCIPANWPAEERAVGLPAPMNILAMATAHFSRVFVALCDRCGRERGVQFEGGTVIVGPDGRPLAGPMLGHSPGRIVVECDIDQARDKAWNTRNDAFRDRRPDVYTKMRGRIHRTGTS